MPSDQISLSFEKKQYCPGVFLDVSQVSDCVWHKDMLCKLKQFLPASYYLTIKFYLENCTFVVRQYHGVSPGGDLSSDLFNIYTADTPNIANMISATYGNDTAILYLGNDPI